MRKLLTLVFVLISVFSMAQFAPSGAKTLFANGVALGTKSGFNYPDSNVIYWRWDSTLMAKYKGTARALAWSVSGGYLPISDTTSMLSHYPLLSGSRPFTGTVTGTMINMTGATGYQLNGFNTLAFTGNTLVMGGYSSSQWQRVALAVNGDTALKFESNKYATFLDTMKAKAIVKTSSTNAKFLLGAGADIDTSTLLQTRPLNNQFYDSLSAVRSRANSNVNYWQRPSTYVSPATAGDGIRVPDATNTYVTYIPGNGNLSTGVNGGNQTSMGSDQFTFYQSAPNKYSNINTRNLTANRNIYFPNADITVADSATVAGKLSLTGGTLSGALSIGTNAFTSGTISSGDITTNGNNKGLYFNGTRNAVLGSNAADEVYIAAANATKLTAGSAGITINGIGTGTVQATAGLLSVISDSKYKNKGGLFKGNAYEDLMRIPKPEYWSYNDNSGYPNDVKKVKQFGLFADSVYNVLGEEFAPSQPQSQKDSLSGVVNHSLSDRALLSLFIQAFQEFAAKKEKEVADLTTKYEALLQRVIKLEQK